MAQEDNLKYIFITEKSVNYYKNQVYLNFGETEKYLVKIVHKTCQWHIVVTVKIKFMEIMGEVLVEKCLICIFVTRRTFS